METAYYEDLNCVDKQHHRVSELARQKIAFVRKITVKRTGFLITIPGVYGLIFYLNPAVLHFTKEDLWVNMVQFRYLLGQCSQKHCLQ